MQTRRQFGATLLAAPMFAGRAFAETFPSHQLRLIVPYAAGGGTDAIARLIAEATGDQLGKNMLVENNGSGGGNVATVMAAAAAPDGYTVLMANQGPMVVNPHLFKSLKIDPLTAFDPVTLITSAPLVAVVPKASQYATFKALIDFGSANPGRLTYGSAGNGSASHMAVVLLARIAKLDMVHVPFRGAGPAISDLLGGREDFMITTLPSIIGLIDSGQVRALAVTSKTRTKRLPDVPTIAESGWPDYESGAWYGFVVPKGSPADNVATLRTATIAAINSSRVRARLASEGAEPIGSSAADFAAMMSAESARWAEVLKDNPVAVE